MNNNSRFKNTILNSMYGIFAYMGIMTMTFVSRSIFADALGPEYLGLNSLFSNVMSLLNLTELGLSTAIVYFLYEPVAKEDYATIKMYLSFYKKLFLGIATIIIALGVVVSLFIDRITNSTIPSGELQFYFMLYLFSTIATYLCVYKTSILYADQKNRVISKYNALSKGSMLLVQMAVIYYTRNYTLYLILLIIGNIIENLLTSRYVDRNYKFLQTVKCRQISIEEKKELMYKTKSIATQKFAGFFIGSTDNIIISKVIDMVSVGLYSNYYLISSTLKVIFSQIFAAFTNSFGNMTALSEKEELFNVYKKAEFIAFSFGCITSIMYLALIQPFISIWMGNEYVMDISTPILITVAYYIYLMAMPGYSVQNALALHHVDKNIILFQAGIHLVLSIMLTNIMGINGVIFAAIISNIIPAISKAYVAYRVVFEKSLLNYFVQYTKKTFLYIILLCVSMYIVRMIHIQNIYIEFIVKASMSFMIPTVSIIGIYANTPELQYFLCKIKNIKTRL